MTYDELRTTFSGLLKRGDLTTTQRDTWLQAGLARAQTLLRVPAMEKYAEYAFADLVSGAVTIPADYLKLKSMYVVDGDKLKLRDITDVNKLRKSTGTPKIYARRGGSFVLGYYPSSDTSIGVEYYSELPGLSAGSDTNWLADIRPSCIYKAALSEAGSYFLDRRQDKWEAEFVRDISELNEQAAQDELSDGQMSSGIEYEDD